jgi:hypothetical protein
VIALDVDQHMPIRRPAPDAAFHPHAVAYFAANGVLSIATLSGELNDGFIAQHQPVRTGEFSNSPSCTGFMLIQPTHPGTLFLQ